MTEVAVPITIIKMRDGEEIKVSRETGEKIREKLGDADTTKQINITEAGVMVNSAEIVKIYDDVKKRAKRRNEAEDEEWTDEDRRKARKRLNEIRKELEAKSIIPPKHD